MLWPPCGSENCVRDGFNVTNAGRFDLSEVATKITDHIRALKIVGSLSQRPALFASRANALLNDALLTERT